MGLTCFFNSSAMFYIPSHEIKAGADKPRPSHNKTNALQRKRNPVIMGHALRDRWKNPFGGWPQDETLSG